MKEATEDFEGAEIVNGKKQKLPKDSWVCNGYYWNPVPGRGGARWYTESTEPQERTFRIRYVVHPNVAPDPVSPRNPLPNRKDKEIIGELNPVLVSTRLHGAALSEIARRAMIDFEEEWVVDDDEILGNNYDETDDEHESDGEHDD